MKLEFVGQSRKDSDNPSADTSRLVNLYREPSEDGFVLKSVLGTEAFAAVDGVLCRAMAEIEGDIYAVIGGGLYRIEELGTVTRLGDIADASRTSIVGNNGSVCVAAGGVYYVWDGATLSEPTGGAFALAGSVAFLGQLTVITELNGRRFQWTGVADPGALDGLDYSTAEGQDDRIIRAVVINGNLWLFKVKSTEIWYLDGAGFSRISGGVLDTGLRSFGLVTLFDNGAFFIGDDGICYITNGSGAQPVSIPPVETDISQGVPSRCFFYEDEGHKFCVIRFADRAAWVYDISTGEWHNRVSGVADDPWPMVASAKAWGRWFVGSDSGAVLRLGRTNADHDGPMKRRAVSRTIGGGISVSELELFPKVGIETVGGRSPDLMLRVSRNRGMTWGLEKRKGCGQVGHYERRVRFQGLGWGQNITIEVAMTDPVDVPLLAYAEVMAQ